jgi:penicillin amidase
MKFVLSCLGLAMIVGCSSASHKSFKERQAALSLKGLGISPQTELRWNAYGVPYVLAQSEIEAYRVLGAVHAHLRLGQLEFFRRVAAGRLSESAGPVTLELDHALRALNLGLVVDQIWERLPQESRVILETFVDGMNRQIRVMRTPPEFGLLGWRKAEFTAQDLLRIGRLATVDVNWFVYFRLLTYVDTPQGASLWNLFRGLEGSAQALRNENSERLAQVLGLSGHWASNSWAVSPKKSKSGSAMIANDPHLGITQPPIWLMAGMHTPSLQITGLMIPGLPVWALGRTSSIAWGGTNMRSLSSVLVRVPQNQKLEERAERIAVRWWPDRERKVRVSPWGPVLTDLDFFKSPSPIALRWEGHEWSDELTAFLKANRAKNVRGFRDAFKNYAVSGQNMLVVDSRGDIAHVMAVRLPDRRVDEPHNYVLEPTELNPSNRDALSLPFVLNPKQGVLVSANDRSYEGDPALGLFFSPKDRADRIRDRLMSQSQWSVDEFRVLQQDTHSHSSLLLARRLCGIAGFSSLLETAEFCRWNGSYTKDSRSAVLFQHWLYHFTKLRLKQLLPTIEAEALEQSDYLRSYLAGTWTKFSDVRDVAAVSAWKQALKSSEEFPTWGSFHRLSLGHPLGNAPVVGSRFRYWEGPTDGGSETVFKTAHGLTTEKHTTRYGTNARHVSDMSDLDANEFVLMGGNDGWVGSQNQADQLPLVMQGKSIRMPLRLESIRAEFPHSSTTEP